MVIEEGTSGSTLGDEFSFVQPLPKKNPLLARSTVSDRTVNKKEENPRSLDSVKSDRTSSMGAAMSEPVVLSRHHRTHPPRKHMPFEKGYSQMDWMILSRNNKDLSGQKARIYRRDITLDEVAEHRKPDDCWTVLRGRVYNLTPYLQYHPGGAKILMSVAGRDGTAMFDKYHAWVNAEFLLAKCLIGTLQPTNA